MKCPKCKGKLLVLDNVNDEENFETYRLKKCRECGHSLYTVESEVFVNESFKSAWRKNYRKHKNK